MSQGVSWNKAGGARCTVLSTAMGKEKGARRQLSRLVSSVCAVTEVSNSILACTQLSRSKKVAGEGPSAEERQAETYQGTANSFSVHPVLSLPLSAATGRLNSKHIQHAHSWAVKVRVSVGISTGQLSPVVSVQYLGCVPSVSDWQTPSSRTEFMELVDTGMVS